MKKILLATALTSTLLLAFDAGESMNKSTLPGFTGIGGFWQLKYKYSVPVNKNGSEIYLNLENGEFYKDYELTTKSTDNHIINENKVNKLKEETKKEKKQTLDEEFVNKFNAQFSEKSTFATTTLLKANVSRLHIPVFIKSTLNVDNNVTDGERTKHVLLDPNSGHLNIRFDIFDWVVRRYDVDTNNIENFSSYDYDSYGLSVQVGTKIEKFSDEYKNTFASNGDFYFIPYTNVLVQADMSTYIFNENKHNRFGSLIIGAMASVQFLPEDEMENLLPEQDLGSEFCTGSLFFSIDLAEKAALKLTHSFEIGNPSFNKTQLGIELRP